MALIAAFEGNPSQSLTAVIQLDGSQQEVSFNISQTVAAANHLPPVAFDGLDVNSAHTINVRYGAAVEKSSFACIYVIALEVTYPYELDSPFVTDLLAKHPSDGKSKVVAIGAGVASAMALVLLIVLVWRCRRLTATSGKRTLEQLHPYSRTQSLDASEPIELNCTISKTQKGAQKMGIPAEAHNPGLDSTDAETLRLMNVDEPQDPHRRWRALALDEAQLRLQTQASAQSHELRPDTKDAVRGVTPEGADDEADDVDPATFAALRSAMRRTHFPVGALLASLDRVSVWQAGGGEARAWDAPPPTYLSQP